MTSKKLFLVNRAFSLPEKDLDEKEGYECCADCQNLRWGCEECDCHICNLTSKDISNVNTHTCDSFKRIEHKGVWEDVSVVELTPSDLELLKVDELMIIHNMKQNKDTSREPIKKREALLKKLEAVE